MNVSNIVTEASEGYVFTGVCHFNSGGGGEGRSATSKVSGQHLPPPGTRSQHLPPSLPSPWDQVTTPPSPPPDWVTTPPSPSPQGPGHIHLPPSFNEDQRSLQAFLLLQVRHGR